MRNVIDRKKLHNDLKRVITESFETVYGNQHINEAIRKRRTNIFTIAATNMYDDEGVDDIQYTGMTYYSQDDAIDAARKMAEDWKDSEDCICISVYTGEYETPNGETRGEPYDIYTISNKSKEATMSAREEAGYASLEVDEYVY